MFHLYGPQGPTLLSNGPTSVEIQGRWIADTIKQIERDGIKYINPTDEAGKDWKKKINDLSDASLFPTTKSTYMGEWSFPHRNSVLLREFCYTEQQLTRLGWQTGGSAPEKAFEMTCYAGGMAAYHDEIRSVLPKLEGFHIVKASA